MAEARRRCERLGDKMAEAWRCSERNRDGFAGLRVILQIWTLGDNFFGAHSASAPPPSHNFLHLLYTITPYLPSILSFTFYPLPYNQDHRIYLFYLSPPSFPLSPFTYTLPYCEGSKGRRPPKHSFRTSFHLFLAVRVPIGFPNLPQTVFQE